MLVILKLMLGAALTGGCYALCRFFVIPPLLASGLTAWGCFCFLFSFELSGAKARIRNGMEEKSTLQRLWMLAGILCVLMAVGVVFFRI